MNASFLIATLCLLAGSSDSNAGGVISGVAINGTAAGAPLPGAEIVLRASQDGAFVPVAQTTTGQDGHFSFDGLPVGTGMIFLAGSNRQGVHYPGPRVQLDKARPSVQVRLIAYDATESPSPLIVQRHEIEVRPAAEFLEITEALIVDNPTLTAYVGEPSEEGESVTLQLSLPSGIDNVTFEREFHGRNFHLHEDKLSTSLPWRPGRHELKFTYRLPPDRAKLFARQLDRPTQQMIVRVAASDRDQIACNLPESEQLDDNLRIFEQHGGDTAIPAGFAVELQIGSLPIGFRGYARIIASVALCSLVAGTLWKTQRKVKD